MIRALTIAILFGLCAGASAQTMGVMAGLSATPAAACNGLKLDHETVTGSPTVSACDIVAEPLFGM